MVRGTFFQRGNRCIIQELPSNKSLGVLDGFFGDFLKRCWPTVSQQFYKLSQGFYEGNIYMQIINASHIVPVPNIENPQRWVIIDLFPC
jgi:hypothetical protein